MLRKPGRIGRILAVAFLFVLGGPACVQILGDDYTISDDAHGGGDSCSSEPCGACAGCALANDCSGPSSACDAILCRSYDECCLSCDCFGDPQCNGDCSNEGNIFDAVALCVNGACPGCNSVTGGGT